MSTAGLTVPAVPAGRPLPRNASASWVTIGATEGVTVSGADALLVIGLVALVLAGGAFVIVLRRFPARARRGRQGQAAQPAGRAGSGRSGRDPGPRAGRRGPILGRAAEAAEQAAQQAADGRREVEDEIRAVKDEIRQLRGDLERREQRIGEREQRLDDESRRLETRGQALEERRSELEERARALTEAGARAGKELERVAGLTAEQAKAELVATMENQAKREAAVSIRDIEATAKVRGRQAGAQDRDARHPAGRGRADERVRRLGHAPARR